VLEQRRRDRQATLLPARRWGGPVGLMLRRRAPKGEPFGHANLHRQEKQATAVRTPSLIWAWRVLVSTFPGMAGRLVDRLATARAPRGRQRRWWREWRRARCCHHRDRDHPADCERQARGRGAGGVRDAVRRERLHGRRVAPHSAAQHSTAWDSIAQHIILYAMLCYARWHRDSCGFWHLFLQLAPHRRI
jgi:hypothetical protein